MITNPTTTHRPTRRPLRLPTVALLATALVLGACGSDTTDAGDDLSAEVEVSGVRPTGDGEPGGASEREGSTPEPAEGAGPDTSEEPATTVDPETARILPAIAFDGRARGRSATYLGLEITLGSLIFTNQDLEEYTTDADPSDDRETIVVEVSVTNSGRSQVTVPEELFAIELASGERIAPDDLRSPDGDSLWAIQPQAQATEHALLAFAEVDLAGASFVIAEAGAIAEYIPLDGPAPEPEPYRVELATLPAVADLRSPSPWDGCDYAWTGEVVAATVGLEGVDGSRLDRADLNERWLAIELLVTNTTTGAAEFSPCNTSGMAVTAVDPRLRIDGVAISGESPGRIGDRIDEAASTVVQYWFPIGASTPRVELTDVYGAVIAAWDLDLPAARGEG